MIRTMSKLTLTGFALVSVLFFGNSSENYAAQPKQYSSGAPTGTLQKMIVENGSVTLNLDLNGLNGSNDLTTRPVTLRFAAASDSFFPILVFNDLLRGPEPGSNGMTLDGRGRVTVAGHARRNVFRFETLAPDSRLTVLAERYQGKRLSSPNDLVYRSDGSLYFTDPPYGLPKQDDDPAKELKFNGVFRLAGGKLTVAVNDMTRPNGIAFSPDEKTLYVDNSDEKKKVWMAYDLAADGTATNGRIFADVTTETADGLPDGMKLDEKGNIYGAGPGGIWVFSPGGKHLGTIRPPETPANCNWGDDGKTLYITATTSVYRIKIAVSGEKPLYQVYK